MAAGDITPEQMDELTNVFDTVDANGNGKIELEELQDALEICGFRLARYQVKDLIREHDVNEQDGMLDFEEFRRLLRTLRKNDFGANLMRVVHARDDLVTVQSRATEESDVKHSVRIEEQKAFADWINKKLADDPDCQRHLPLAEDGSDLYEKCGDGILLCKLVNVASPGKIDERVINKSQNLSLFKRSENITLALNSAQSIGCVIVSVGAAEIMKATKHLIMGLLWQIIKVGLLSNVTFAADTDLRALLNTSEFTIEELRAMAPEQLLMEWVNFHLERAGSQRRIGNFSEDISDSEVYANLLDQILPDECRDNMHSVQTIMQESNPHKRADLALQNAALADVRVFVQPNDVVTGDSKLNMAFVATLFHKFPHVADAASATAADEKDEEVEGGGGGGGGGGGPNWDEDGVIEETREERTYRNWMNSMNVEPRVNYLYTDLANSTVYFQLYDIVRPGVVNWKRVNTKFSKFRQRFQRLENCNYAVELGKQIGFSLVGIGGEDLVDSNVTLTLALVWQLMRAYTLAILNELAASSSTAKVDEKYIIGWANNRLKEAGKESSFTSFQDASISDCRCVLDLIDCIRPASVRWEDVNEGTTEAQRLDNAKFAISLGWKIGAKIYALPEDIVEVKPKMVMTLFACLMQLDLQQKAAGSSSGSSGIGSHLSET